MMTSFIKRDPSYRSCWRWAILAISFSLALAACGGDPLGSSDTPDNERPTAVVRVDTLSGNAPLSIAVDGRDSFDSDGSIADYLWDFGDGTVKTGERQTHTYREAGVYRLRLTVTDNGGAQGFSEVQIEVFPEDLTPTARIDSDLARGVAPLEVSFSALNSTASRESGAIVEYHWVLAGDTERSGEEVTHTFDQPGEYLVTLLITDDLGATDTATTTVTVLSSNATFTLEGTITSMPYTDVDGTVNDPSALYFNNNGHSTGQMQPVGNPVVLNGFLTANPTGEVGDVFRFDSDRHDFYQVDLREGDFVSLRIIDYQSADLDLFLFEAATLDVRGVSDGFGEFESIRAPEAGRYYVMVNAEQGSSKYVLNIGEHSFMAGPAASGQSVDFEPDQAIVEFRDLPVSQVRQSMVQRAQMQLSHRQPGRAALARLNALNPQTRYVLGLHEPQSFERFLAQTNPDAAAKYRTLRAIKRLREEEEIAIAEVNHRLRPLLTPNDPAFEFQWHYFAINLPQAWDTTIGDPSVIVAVIDTGVYLAHPDLQGQLVGGYDFISDPEVAGHENGINPNPDDPGDSSRLGRSSWHGTHVAGTIAAVMNNGIGVAGVAPGVRVMPLRALGRGGGSAYDVLQSVRFAAGLANDSGTIPERRADVINLSLGGAGYSQTAQNLYRQVRDLGIFVVGASGNSNSGEPLYPASYEGVFSVAASDYLGNRAPYSNFGPYVDVAAPGGDTSVDRNNNGYPDGILSLTVNETRTSRSGGYGFSQGTSMAAPHFSGVLALMKSVHPGLTVEEVRSLLASGVLTQPRDHVGRDDYLGYGVIDALLGVQAAQQLASGGTTAAILANPSTLAFEDATGPQVIEVSAVGSGAIGVAEIVADAWLEVTALEVNSQGLGTYQVEVIREGLADGSYRGEIDFISTENSVSRVAVTLRVGEVVETGNAGYLYILLVEAASGETVAMEQGGSSDGTYRFRFENVPIGDYLVAAGSDIDNDGFVCDDGEMCGFFPSASDVETLRVDRDLRDLNFSVGLSAPIGNSSMTAQGEHPRVPWSLRRQSAPNKTLSF